MTNPSVSVDNELSKPGIARLEGLNWPWMVTQEGLDAIKNFEVWKDDVWVTTFPKSGTHWAVEIVNLILVDGHEDKINRAECGLPAEFDCTQPGMTASSRRPPKRLPEYKDLTTWKAPRVIMTHLPEERMPSQIYQGKGKVVFVIRNPKDVAVSLWHFIVPYRFDERHNDWDFYFQQYLEGETIYGSWFDHTLNFWNKHRHDKNFLFITFEDMKQDIRGSVIRIADFLGKPLSEEVINRVIEFSSMKSMKTRFDTADNPQLMTDSNQKIEDFKLGAPSILRKGVTGDWKNKLTVAQNEALDALYQQRMAGSDIKIQFE